MAKVYVQREPSPLGRVVGRVPLVATVYELHARGATCAGGCLAQPRLTASERKSTTRRRRA